MNPKRRTFFVASQRKKSCSCQLSTVLENLLEHQQEWGMSAKWINIYINHNQWNRKDIWIVPTYVEAAQRIKLEPIRKLKLGTPARHGMNLSHPMPHEFWTRINGNYCNCPSMECVAIRFFFWVKIGCTTNQISCMFFVKKVCTYLCANRLTI